jgi:hypothetical protein
MIRHIVSATIIFNISLLIGCSGTSEREAKSRPSTEHIPFRMPKDESQEERPGISAKKLWTAYKENQLAAARLYEGKEIEVWGTVKKVEGGEEGSILTLVPQKDDISGIRCDFHARHNDAIAKLRPGEIVSLRGKVVNWRVEDVIMHECALVER